MKKVLYGVDAWYSIDTDTKTLNATALTAKQYKEQLNSYKKIVAEHASNEYDVSLIEHIYKSSKYRMTEQVFTCGLSTTTLYKIELDEGYSFNKGVTIANFLEGNDDN